MAVTEMLHKIESEKTIWRWRWPIVAIAVLVGLLSVQMLRVNKPSPIEREIRIYSAPGSLIAGDLIIPAVEYHSTRIDLNRRAKVAGVFRTKDHKSRVSVLVLREVEFANWKDGLEYQTITETGYVPAGKISPVLDVGIYFLIIDNRLSDKPQKVRADFVLE